ncbi:alpha/beta fold hydrolase [Pseudonocardia asaccharolytica]|uniref:Alpha/beta hydrolase n=1 Tax=Pseudonocardia asaccharolytica DSM 44247 = NBRC 16224 TaxID=1123024 RepID=A0A511D0R8_9PSEU|nr:alpha/beta fold hydrolase [Pseudonocardia asaccharolytica]GEL18382.1 alpha/beta hydrolase [Pseudonocardia asaccharolytica DSM 44247 = NBRC 16224]
MTATAGVAERRVATLGGQVNPRVLVAGQGPPVVYLHGAMGLQWDPFLDALAQHNTVYAPEHPGTTPGDPDAIKAVDDLWDLVLHHYDLFDELDLDAPAVVGHSFGGMIGAEIAATNPERVNRLVLLCPVGLWRDDIPVAQFLQMTPQEVVEIAFADPQGELAQEFLRMPEDPEQMADALIAATWAQACTGKFMWPFPEKGLHKRLYRIRARTLIVWGEQDRLAPPAYAEEFASRIGGARVERIRDAAHLPQLEQTEQVARLVADFLAE